MATSILKRLVRFATGSAHDALDKIEDPGATARQMVRELSAEVAKTEEAVAAVIADQMGLQKKLDAEKEAATSWQAKAKAAVVASRDDLATQALDRATRAERNVTIYEKSLSALTPSVDALKAKLAELRRKRDDAKNETELLEARATSAKAQGRAARILGSVGDNTIDFEGVRERVDKIEAQAGALDMLAQEKAGDGIDAELAKLGVTPVSDRLAALKAEVAAEHSEV